MTPPNERPMKSTSPPRTSGAKSTTSSKLRIFDFRSRPGSSTRWHRRAHARCSTSAAPVPHSNSCSSRTLSTSGSTSRSISLRRISMKSISSRTPSNSTVVISTSSSPRDCSNTWERPKRTSFAKSRRSSARAENSSSRTRISNTAGHLSTGPTPMYKTPTAFRSSLEQSFIVERQLPTALNWSHSQPVRPLTKAVNTGFNLTIPVVTAKLAVEYFFVCSARPRG